MHRPHHLARRVVTALVAVALATGFVAASSAAAHRVGSGEGPAWTSSLVATGLDSPRGLLVTPSGRLLVAEAGHGGDVCGSILAGQLCIGLSSKISTVNPVDGTHTPLVTGLYSRSVPTQGITGVDGISTDGGRLEGVITSYPQELTGLSCTGQPADCPEVLAAARAQAGQLITFTPGGTFRAVAGVGSFDFRWASLNPEYSTEPPNANPYGILALPGSALVADAGANALDFAAVNGWVSVLSAFTPPLPPGGFPADTVPTCVTLVRGHLYVASLSGHLWKLNGGFMPTAVPVTDGAGHSLIHHVTGCVSDERTGAIYLVDMWNAPTPPLPTTAGSGSVVELTSDGKASVIASGLTFPNGIARGRGGSLYVTVDSTCTATGSPLPFCAAGGGIIKLHH